MIKLFQTINHFLNEHFAVDKIITLGTVAFGLILTFENINKASGLVAGLLTIAFIGLRILSLHEDRQDKKRQRRIVGTITTLVALVGTTFQYNTSNTTWYRSV